MLMTPVETKVKVNFRCRPEFKSKIKNSIALVHISVGQNYHEGEKFIATMDLINETFKYCYVMLCDSLQRHSLKLKYSNLSDSELYRLALEKGDEWLIRNGNILKALTIPYKIYRWDFWLSHPDYAKYKIEVDKLYYHHQKFQQAVKATIEKYLARQNIERSKHEKAFNLCKQYILEECPILIPLWAKTNANFVVYPRFRTPIMTLMHDLYINSKQSTLLNEIALKFHRRVKAKKLNLKNNRQDYEQLYCEC